MEEATAQALGDIYKALERIEVVLTEITRPDRVVSHDQQMTDHIIELRTAIHDLRTRDSRIKTGED